jgi:hypothetical protein
MALAKPLHELGPEDIEGLIADAWPESETLELKEAIPSNKREPDRWYADQQGLGDRGRNELLAEVVAFANSQGGDLAIGIAETEDIPARADQLKPVPACHDLARRLEMMARDCIEPGIPLLAARGIPMTDDGAGVVIVRVPASRAAPHRLIPTRECYHRRRDRTEKMTMREIQDLTFAMARGAEAVEQRLQALHDGFQQMLDTKPIAEGYTRLAVGVSAVPTTRGLSAANIHRNPALAFRARDYRLLFANGVETHSRTNTWVGPLRPMLRGARSRHTGDHRGQTFSLWSDGAIGWWWHIDSSRTVTDHNRREHCLYANWLAGDVLNVADWADRYRREVGANAIEYAVRTDIVTSTELAVLGLQNHPFDGIGQLAAGSWTFPAYSLAGSDERPALVSAVLMDLWNLVGADFGDVPVTTVEPIGR